MSSKEEKTSLYLRRHHQERDNKRNNDLPPSFSTILNDIHDDKRSMHSEIRKLINKLEKSFLISPMVFSEYDDNDDDDMN